MGITCFFHHCDKIPVKINLKEENFVLARGFRDFSHDRLSVVAGL